MLECNSTFLGSVALWVKSIHFCQHAEFDLIHKFNVLISHHAMDNHII